MVLAVASSRGGSGGCGLIDAPALGGQRIVAVVCRESVSAGVEMARKLTEVSIQVLNCDSLVASPRCRRQVWSCHGH